MKSQKILSCLISAFIGLNVQHLPAQKPIRDLFPERNVVAQYDIDVVPQSLYSVNANNRFVSIFGYSDSGNIYEKVHVYLFDVNGSLLWRKKFAAVHRVELSEEADKVIVIYDDRIREIDRDKWRNACFDRAGNKLWDIVVPSRGITMSPDGKYGIVAIGGGGDRHFRVYDIDRGTDLETPIPKGSHGFRAQFVDSERVVVLIQNIDVARDTVALKRVLRMKREGGFNPRKGVPNTWINTYHPAIFIIYDIPSQTILTERELFSPNGEPLYVPMGGAKYMSVSADKKHIALALYKFLIPPDKKRNLTLVQVDLEGNVEWENTDLQTSYIHGVLGLGNGTILINKPAREFEMIDRSTGNTIWRYKTNQQGSSIIRDILVQNNHIVMQTTDFAMNSRIHMLDQVTGSVLETPEYWTDEILLLTNTARTVIYNKTQNKLQFLE